MREYEFYIDPDAAQLLKNLESMGGVKLRDLSLADARAAAVSMGQQLDLPWPLGLSPVRSAVRLEFVVCLDRDHSREPDRLGGDIVVGAQRLE
jgi:hypothetical protein